MKLSDDSHVMRFMTVSVNEGLGDRKELSDFLSEGVHFDGFENVGPSAHGQGLFKVLLLVKIGVHDHDHLREHFLDLLQQPEASLHRDAQIDQDEREGDILHQVDRLLFSCGEVTLAVPANLDGPRKQFPHVVVGFDDEYVLSVHLRHGGNPILSKKRSRGKRGKTEREAVGNRRVKGPRPPRQGL